MTRRLTILAFASLIAASFLAFTMYQRGYVRFNNPSHSEYPVRGIDVSHHQQEIDWPRAVKAANIEFAYIKATEDRDLVDPRFGENWANSKGLLARGAYHFFTFCTPAADQALHFLKSLPIDSELPAAIDVEFAGNCENWESHEQIRAELRIFISIVSADRGQPPVLYVTKESYEHLVRDHVDGHRLWLREVVLQPAPSEYPAMTFWQYAGNGRVDGIDTLVDLNAFIGGRPSFAQLIAASDRSARDSQNPWLAP